MIYKRNWPSKLGGASIRRGAFIGDNTVGGYPPVDGPKDPWPRHHVLSLPERFVGDPASLARDNMYTLQTFSNQVTHLEFIEPFSL